MSYSIIQISWHILYYNHKMAYSELLYIYINKRSFPINYIIKSFFFTLQFFTYLKFRKTHFLLGKFNLCPNVKYTEFFNILTLD